METNNGKKLGRINNVHENGTFNVENFENNSNNPKKYKLPANKLTYIKPEKGNMEEVD